MTLAITNVVNDLNVEVDQLAAVRNDAVTNRRPLTQGTHKYAESLNQYAQATAKFNKERIELLNEASPFTIGNSQDDLAPLKQDANGARDLLVQRTGQRVTGGLLPKAKRLAEDTIPRVTACEKVMNFVKSWPFAFGLGMVAVPPLRLAVAQTLMGLGYALNWTCSNYNTVIAPNLGNSTATNGTAPNNGTFPGNFTV